jgi:transposase InsO family protein
VCDHGSQFTCSEFRRVCAVIQLAVDYAPPQYPQYKGKIERFFRTARSEMPRAQAPEMASGLHAAWIAEYNHDRIHSRVTDAAGHAQAPVFRLRWKPSAARPKPGQHLRYAGAELNRLYLVYIISMSNHAA